MNPKLAGCHTHDRSFITVMGGIGGWSISDSSSDLRVPRVSPLRPGIAQIPVPTDRPPETP